MPVHALADLEQLAAGLGVVGDHQGGVVRGQDRALDELRLHPSRDADPPRLEHDRPLRLAGEALGLELGVELGLGGVGLEPDHALLLVADGEAVASEVRGVGLQSLEDGLLVGVRRFGEGCRHPSSASGSRDRALRQASPRRLHSHRQSTDRRRPSGQLLVGDDVGPQFLVTVPLTALALICSFDTNAGWLLVVRQDEAADVADHLARLD
jgi:hypothetical protein